MTFFREVIDPRMAAEIAMRNPQAALSLCQAADEVGDAEWIYRFYREFFDYVFRRSRPGEIFERKPEAVIVWAELARHLGGWRFLERHEGKIFPPEFIDRGLDPRHLLELSEHSPQAALAWVQLIRELGGGRFFERHGAEFFERAFETKHLPELIERHPEVALAWLQLLREFGGGRFTERFDKELFHPEFIERAFRPHKLLELAENDPEAALTWMQLARELGGERTRALFAEKLLSRDVFERMLHPRHLLELAERNPEAAMAWLRAATELGGDQFIEGHGQEFFDRTFDSFVLDRLLHGKPAAFAVALRLARLTRSARAIEAVEECLAPRLRRSKVAQSAIANLPIAALPDLEWLANESKNPELRHIVEFMRPNGMR